MVDGAADEERIDALGKLIAQDLAAFEPLLRAGATVEIDIRRPLAEVVDELESIAGRAPAELVIAS